MEDSMSLDDVRKLREQRAQIDRQLADAKGVVVKQIEALAREFNLTAADVGYIFSSEKTRERSSGKSIQAKYRTPDGQEWTGVGANPPKAFVPYIRDGRLHELCIDKNEKNIQKAKDYSEKWLLRQKG